MQKSKFYDLASYSSKFDAVKTDSMVNFVVYRMGGAQAHMSPGPGSKEQMGQGPYGPRGSCGGTAKHRSRRQARRCSCTDKVFHCASTSAQVWTVVMKQTNHWEVDLVQSGTMRGEMLVTVGP